MKDLQCDFCGDLHPIFSWECCDAVFEVYDYVTGKMHIHRSEGNWVACGKCHQFILCEDRTGLANRSAQEYLQISETSHKNLDLIFAMMFAYQTIFWNGKSGEYYPVIFDLDEGRGN